MSGPGARPIAVDAALGVAAGVAVAAAPAAAAGGIERQLTLDATLVGVKAGYAQRSDGGTFLGTAFGLGGDIAPGFMLLAGRHFSEDGWFTYEERDVADGEELFEFVQVDLFARSERGAWQWDAGVHASVFFHWDDSDDDAGGGTFVGAFVQPMWGGERWKVGPRIIAGAFSEGRAEFGIHVTPVVGRLVVGW